ncbi:hypothetical protein ABHV50_004156 [Vibrio vulnificus]|nr:hypothetical protein [Vibrio vulnificus]HDU8731591.1 hypothetical protein [Vibrio vulnificus]HDU8768330.1 hypothetical protein [Vibrio vulnificus]
MSPGFVSVLLPLLTELAPSLISRIIGNDEEKNKQAVLQIKSAIEDVTGQSLNAPKDVSELQAALQKNAILRADIQRALAILEYRTAQAYLGDKQDARARDVSLAQQGRSNLRASMMFILAFLGVITIVCVLVLFSNDEQFPKEVSGFLIGVGGMFVRSISAAFEFEFGASHRRQ